MMLRVLLWWLRPKDNRKDESFWNRCRAYCYKTVILLLKRYYRRYAISDTITLQEQGVIVVQECRDLEFEKALNQLGVDIRPKWNEAKVFPQTKKPSFGYRFFFSFFHFTQTVHLYIGEKEISLRRDQGLTYHTDLRGTLKKSKSSDIINRTWFKSEKRPDIPEQKEQEVRVEPQHREAKQQNRGVEIDESF